MQGCNTSWVFGGVDGGGSGRRARACLTLIAVAAASPQIASAGGQVTRSCRVEGMPNELQCGLVQRPLDPANRAGVQIEVHYLVVPAMARNKQPDAVLVLAGGPGQSAVDIAPLVMSRLSRLNNRRDMVFIDQRGTGRSAPLQCEDESRLSVQESLDPEKQLARIRQCSETLGKLPYGDLRFFNTTLAVQDFDAVRAQLGVPQWNLVGASYGTRAALEYLRLFPDKVRRTIMDGVAPPDMVLPASFSVDGQAALEQIFSACAKDTQGNTACSRRYPKLRTQWTELLQSLPRAVSVDHPLTGVSERFTLSRGALLQAVRAPLYAPTLASGLPAAIHAAAQGRFEGLVGLSGALGNRKSMRLALGMHFSVVCAEDVPRMTSAAAVSGPDFGAEDAEKYASVCKFWPRGKVDDAFYTVPTASSPVLLLSGGADPVTPPRHGERVAKALGAKAQHIVVPEAGHGVSGIGCMRDVVARFVTESSDAQAMPHDVACATKIPRPGAFLPIQSGISAGDRP